MSPDVTLGSVQVAGGEKHSASQKDKEESSSSGIYAKRLKREWIHVHGIRPHFKPYTGHSHTISIFNSIIGDLQVEFMSVEQHRERPFVRVGVHALEQRQLGL
jgi:hypothetical protein